VNRRSAVGERFPAVPVLPAAGEPLPAWLVAVPPLEAAGVPATGADVVDELALAEPELLLQQ
jgi:hypothetical protein